MRVSVATLCLCAAALLGGCDSDDATDSEVVAANDSAETRPGESVTIDVLANDRGRNLTIESFQERTDAGATVTLTDDDALLYRPSPGHLGTDAFTYLARNDEGVTSKRATVTVAVR